MKFSLAFVSILSAFVSILLFWQADLIGSIYQNSLLPEAVRILSAYVFLNNIFRLAFTYLQSRADIKSMQVAQNTQNLSKLLSTVLFFYLFGASFVTIAAGYLCSLVLAIIIAAPKIKFSFSDLPAAVTSVPKAEMLKEIIPFGFMVTILSMFSVVIGSFDRIILGYMLDPAVMLEKVAIYSMATTVSLVLMIFPQAIGTIFLPVLSRIAGKGDLHEMREVTETAQRWSLFITMPVALLMISFARDILIVLYGIGYAPGATVMTIFTIGVLIRAFSQVFSFALAALKRIEIEIAIAAAVGCLNVILNIILITLYDMEGAAVASAISFFVMAVILQYFVGKLISFKIPPETYKMFAAAAVVFLIMLPMQPFLSEVFGYIPTFGEQDMAVYLSKLIYLAYLGVLMCISTALFMIISLLLKCFQKEDVILMKKVMRRAKMPQQLISFAESIASRGVAQQK